MAVLNIPPLLADSGEMTIVRPVASHAYGTINITYPEDTDAPEDTDFEQGYTYQLRENPPPFGRGFIRADLDIDAENNTSTVEEILDEVETRTAGEPLFQKDFTRAGLGRLRLGVDVNNGDLVPVRLWGRILERQLITAADDLSTPGNPFGVRIHIGGQLIRQPGSLAAKNRDVARQIAQERKERRAQVKAVDAKAAEAKSTADTAKGTADTAKSTADTALDAVSDADGVIQGYVDEGRQHRDDAEAWATAALEMLADVPPLLDDAELINQQIEGNLLEVQGLHTRVRSLVQRGQGYVNQAYSAVALAQSYNVEISKKLVEARQAVSDGLANVAAAEILLELVIGPGGYIDQAEQILVDTRTARNAATGALSDMNDALNNVDGDGTSFAVAVAAVLTAHNDILDKHGQVLSLHNRAIRVTARAVQSANSAASYALLGVQRLSEAIALMQQANIARDEAILAAASAASDALTVGEKLTTITERLATNQELQVKVNRLLARAISINATATAFATQSAQSAGRAAGASLEAVAALAQTILEKEAAQEAAVEGINVALKLQENAIKWASVLATRVFSSPNIDPNWGQVSNDWVIITKPPDAGVNVAPLTSPRGYGDWFGDITIHYVNTHGQSVVHQHTKTTPGWEGWWLTEAESSAPVRDVVVTLTPYRFHAQREYVFPYTRGGNSFDPVSTYDGIPQSPIRRSDNSYTFAFAVRADRSVRVSPDEGVTWYTVPAGSEIPVLDRVLPVTYMDGPERRVVTFTEVYRKPGDPA